MDNPSPEYSNDPTIQAELARLSQELAGAATRQEVTADLTRLPDGQDASPGQNGTIRTHDEMNGFPASIGLFSAPYTTEEGRALKRAKNLSSQSEADAEAFLKVPPYLLRDTRD